MQNKCTIIDGKSLAANLLSELEAKIAKNNSKPVLAIVMVGDNEASKIYVRNKQKAAKIVGIDCQLYHLPNDIPLNDIQKIVKNLNDNEQINGIIIQQPLPEHLEVNSILNLISAQKDVDGFGVNNLGNLMSNSQKGMIAATPKGIIKILDSLNLKLEGKNALVIGRSNIVGKPMALLLLQKNCTVTVAHSKTQNLKQFAQQSDIIVAACGCPKLVKADWVKDGAVVIDVGINRVDGKLCGDVDFEKVKNKATYITPVPGGVGPMTIAMLLVNTFEAFEMQNSQGKY